MKTKLYIGFVDLVKAFDMKYPQTYTKVVDEH